jgi:hypothetical protein
MRDVSFLFIIFLVVLFHNSCGTSAPLRDVPVRTETVIKERLIHIEIPADSAVMSALLECDSMNNVRLVELHELKSKGVQSKLSINGEASKQSTLTYRLQVVHDTMFVTAKDSIVYKEIPLRVEIPFEVNHVTGWQWFQIWLGRGFMAIWGVVIIYLLLRFIRFF